MENDSYIKSLELHERACTEDARASAMRVRHLKEEIAMHQSELEIALECLDHSSQVAMDAKQLLAEAKDGE